MHFKIDIIQVPGISFFFSHFHLEHRVLLLKNVSLWELSRTPTEYIYRFITAKPQSWDYFNAEEICLLLIALLFYTVEDYRYLKSVFILEGEKQNLPVMQVL